VQECITHTEMDMYIRVLGGYFENNDTAVAKMRYV